MHRYIRNGENYVAIMVGWTWEETLLCLGFSTQLDFRIPVSLILREWA